MPVISAVGLFCCDKFEETLNEKVVNMSKLSKPYFNKGDCSDCSTKLQIVTAAPQRPKPAGFSAKLFLGLVVRLGSNLGTIFYRE